MKGPFKHCIVVFYYLLIIPMRKDKNAMTLSSMAPVIGMVEYDAEIHCKLILDLASRTGSIFEFCKRVKVSDVTFFKWIAKYPLFNEHYRVGLMTSRADWEREGDKSHNDEEWNFGYWKMIGEMRFAVGKSNKVRIEIDRDADPYIQYQQLIAQASYGELTAPEIKQLMESINVGIRAYEVFKQQGEIDNIKEDVKKLSLNHGSHQVPA